MTEMTVQEAQARKAQMIAQVRNGTPPSWTPKPGWANEFTDEEIWDGWRRATRKGPATPMLVAAVLVEDVIEGRHA